MRLPEAEDLVSYDKQRGGNRFGQDWTAGNLGTVNADGEDRDVVKHSRANERYDVERACYDLHSEFSHSGGIDRIKVMTLHCLAGVIAP